MSEKKKDFFISYNKADEQWATWIAAVLEKGGYTCYIEAWDFRPGGNFVLYMDNALKESERFIAVMSQNYLNAVYCQSEWTAAFTKDPNGEKRLLIPVRVADIKPDGLLAAIIYIDLFGADENEAEKRLITGVDTKDVPRNRPSFPGTSRVRFPGSLPFNNLPYIRNGYFTERDRVFEDICAGFQSGSSIALTQSITGMGGLGKTQTALEYAYRYAHKYDWIWWVQAESETTVLIAYKKFAEKMRLLDETQYDRELIIETVLNWMDSHSKWLFIYDNADTVSGDTPWWPKNNRENILITTRNKHILIGKNINIDVFKEEEAVSFLENRTEIRNDREGASRLSERLGYLPLALEQAAAYIKNNGTYRTYLSLLETYKLKLLEEVDGVIDYTIPVTATFDISMEKIKQEAAWQLLYLCAYFNSEGIDAELFSENAELLPPPLGEKISDMLESNKIWRELTRYSLLQQSKSEDSKNQEDIQDRKSYSMHRLLQEIVRNKIKNEPQWSKCCLSLFYKVYDFEYGNIPAQNRFMKLTPHVKAFLDVANTTGWTDGEKETIASLYHEGGWGHGHLGNYSQALEWYQKALVIEEKVLGKEHPATAATYNNIAWVYDGQGDYPKALEWYQKALAIKEKVLGKEHPDTAATYNNIACVYDEQGNYPKALELNQKALAIYEKVLGKEHPDTASIYNNIAVVHDEQGEYFKALEWHKKALAIREKVLGTEHPDTATTYNNIAGVYCNQGDYPKALEWSNKALLILEKCLGSNHPYTKTIQENIEFLNNLIK